MQDLNIAYDGIMHGFGVTEVASIFLVVLVLFAIRRRPRFKGPPSHPIPADDSRLLNRKADQERSVPLEAAHFATTAGIAAVADLAAAWEASERRVERAA